MLMQNQITRVCGDTVFETICLYMPLNTISTGLFVFRGDTGVINGSLT